MAFRTNKTPVLQEKTASGSVASFNTILQKPLVNGEFTIEAYQEGSGDPSPDNVRPIHGFSEVNATRCGVNLWNEEWELGIYRASNGEPSSSNSNIRSKSTNYISVTPNTTYYFYTNGYTMSVFQYASDKSYIGNFSVTNQSRQVDANCYYLRFYIWSSYGNTYNNDISINYPSTDTDYHAYTGNIYTIQLGQEVYGAEVDAVNGVAHCTHRLVDLSSLNWGSYGANRFYFSLPSTARAKSTNLTSLCSCYKREPNNSDSSSMADLSFCVKTGYVVIRDNSFNDVTAFVNSLTGQELIYELAEPFDIQLTPTQIETLIGNNTIFADTGDVDLTYNDLDLAKRGSFREVFKLP